MIAMLLGDKQAKMQCKIKKYQSQPKTSPTTTANTKPYNHRVYKTSTP